MIIVIDIPNEMYERIAVAPRCASYLDAFNDRDMFVKAIQQGIPLKEYADDGTGALNGDCFRYPSDFPKELKELIKNDKEWFTDCRVHVADNNWFECFVYDFDDRFVTSYTVDVEGVSSEGIRNLLLEAIKSQY